MTELFNDIDRYTGSKFDYEKKKLRVDISVMEILWQHEVDSINESYLDQKSLYDQRAVVHAFGKKP